MDQQQGVTVQETTPANPPIDKTRINVPSVRALVCPKCRGNNLRILGMQGARDSAIGAGFAAGLFGGLIGGAIGGAIVGSMVAASEGEQDYSYVPIEYKCEACRNKFEAYPFKAMPDEILDAPCTVNFHRLGAFAGMAVAQTVWLNGIRVGVVKNKQTISFPVYIKHNTVFVTDQFGIAFKGHFTFEAESGGTQEIKFKRKFITE